MYKQCCIVYMYFMLANAVYFQTVHNVNQQLQKCDLLYQEYIRFVLMIANNTTVIIGTMIEFPFKVCTISLTGGMLQELK